MLKLKNKIVIAIGVICLIPTLGMANCHKRGNTISCRGGGSAQLQLTSKETEIYNTSMEIFDEVLNNADNINQAMNGVRSLLSLGKQTYNIVKSSEVKINHLNAKISSVKNELDKASLGREQIKRDLSGLINQRFNEQQYLVHELTSLKQRYRTRIGQLRDINQRLNSVIFNSSNIVSGSLANKFNDYTECLSHNEVLKKLVFTKRDIQGNDSKSNSSYFSSISNGSYMSNYSNFISALSRFSISQNSLYSCAEDFQDLNRQFRIYDVTLGLIVNNASETSINHLFNVYRNQDASSSDITNFLSFFRSTPKYTLQELSDNINSYMLSH